MKVRKGLILTAMYTACSLVLFTGCSKSPSPFMAGFATVNITPAEGTVKDSLYAKSVVFKQGTETGAFVACDIIVIRQSVTEEVRNILSGKTEIPLSNIGISATHTHSAAMCSDLAERSAEAMVKAEAE